RTDALLRTDRFCAAGGKEPRVMAGTGIHNQSADRCRRTGVSDAERWVGADQSERLQLLSTGRGADVVRRCRSGSDDTALVSAFDAADGDQRLLDGADRESQWDSAVPDRDVVPPSEASAD